ADKDAKGPNFTNFDFVPFLCKCSKNRGKDDDCDDEEHEGHHKEHEGHHKEHEGHHKHHHKEHGGPHCWGPDCPNEGPPPTATPLPAALPMMGSVPGGFGIAMWRRRGKQKSV